MKVEAGGRSSTATNLSGSLPSPVGGAPGESRRHGASGLRTSRRRFLEAASVIAAGALLGRAASAGDAGPGRVADGAIVRLNPAFHLRESGAREVVLTTRRADGSVLDHTFGGTEADVLRGARDETSVEAIAAAMARREGLSAARARGRVLRAASSLERAMLIYRGGLMLVKIVET